MGIKDKIYNDCMELARQANIRIVSQKAYAYTYGLNGAPKTVGYNLRSIRQWVDLAEAHYRGLISNIEALDCISLGYVPEHIVVRMGGTY
jgi:hypothetical protein